MNSLYDPRVSAACLALREAPPEALDAEVLRYAHDALAVAQLQPATRTLWRRRSFAMVVAFIVVASVAGWWQHTMVPAPPPQPTVAPAPRAQAPVAVQPAVRPLAQEVRTKASPRVPVRVVPRSVPRSAPRKLRTPAPTVPEPEAAQRESQAPPSRPAPVVEGVEVKTLPTIESIDAVPATDPCVTDPLGPGCGPPS